MQNQVEALSLDAAAHAQSGNSSRSSSGSGSGGSSASSSSSSSGSERDADNQELTRGVTADGVGFYTSDKWARFYPNQEVAVVTSIGQPPIPPEGYVPLRHGHRREQQSLEASPAIEEGVPSGFSVDTLLWDEKLLEQRIMHLTAWTRRSPMPRRQKLDRINRMVNQCNSTNTNTC